MKLEQKEKKQNANSKADAGVYANCKLGARDKKAASQMQIVLRNKNEKQFAGDKQSSFWFGG